MVTIYTIGHSNRSVEEFFQLLQATDVEMLVDIRNIPKSRHNPQFGQDESPGSLAKAAIEYHHMSDLGGLRKTRTDSINGAWRNTSFRGYADYMQSDEFVAAIEKLVDIATDRTTAIMCAEAVPWRCHRSLVGDALLVRGIDVIDIMGPNSTRLHPLTSFAHVDGTTITYPPSDE